MLYDRLGFDLDSEEDPQKAVIEAVGFANLLRSRYGMESLVFGSGFEGAHVVVPLSRPVNWEGYQLLWRGASLYL